MNSGRSCLTSWLVIWKRSRKSSNWVPQVRPLAFIPLFAVRFCLAEAMLFVGIKADCVAVTFLYLRAAGLHFRLSAFFDSPDSPDYQSHLFSLWQATCSFLGCVFDLSRTGNGLLPYASNYVLQMIVAAGFALLKLLNSSFADKVKLAYGRELFQKAVQAIRTISVAVNDLPSRLAEVLAQMWRSGGSGLRSGHGQGDWLENSLQLKTRCRMSMSLVYDSVWRWREEFQAKGQGNLESKSSSRNHGWAVF